MQSIITIIALAIIHFCMTQVVLGQFNIKLPTIPKIDKPNGGNGKNNVETGKSNNSSGKSDRLYRTSRPTSDPVLIPSSIYVDAKTHDEYWKMKGQSNYSSWVPMIRFDSFFDNSRALNYTVEYTNPDGTPWCWETLVQNRSGADRTVRFESGSPYGNGALAERSTNATGVFGFKITDDDTKKVLFQGKFKVGKYSTANGRPDKNKFGFYVDHDWLMPFASVGFHFSDVEIGGVPPLVSVWVKGDISASDLEGRIFFNGKQLGSTKDFGGVSDYDERMTDSAPAFSPLSRWKRWQFEWQNVLFDNNGTFNRENYQNAHYLDKNPGAYTVKIFSKGVQIRELQFTIGADGKFVRPAYSEQLFMPYHWIYVPVKVSGTEEKWNAAAWKTDALYGNPVAGFGQ